MLRLFAHPYASALAWALGIAGWLGLVIVLHIDSLTAFSVFVLVACFIIAKGARLKWMAERGGDPQPGSVEDRLRRLEAVTSTAPQIHHHYYNAPPPSEVVTPAFPPGIGTPSAPLFAQPAEPPQREQTRTDDPESKQ